LIAVVELQGRASKRRVSLEDGTAGPESLGERVTGRTKGDLGATARARPPKAHRERLETQSVTLLDPPALATRQAQAVDSLDTTYGFPFRPVQDSVCGTLEGINTVTGEVIDHFSSRLKRWELQRAAQKLLLGERVSTCMRHRHRNSEGVQVWRREDSSTYYAGLQVCASPWVCPVCAAKISERRRGELLQALTEWKSLGGSVAFLTLTVPHSAHSEPFHLVDTLLTLVERFNSGRNALSKVFPGYVGQVRAFEVTHGEHGWHPHLHILLFLNDPPDLTTLEDRLWKPWEALVRGSGLGRPSRDAFSLQDGSHAALYASKWGIPEEMTKGHFKTARSAKGRTPFALLGDYLTGDAEAGRLFQQFAKVFKGRRQLRWSPNLRRLLGIGIERTDEEEAHSTDVLDQLLGSLTDKQWTFIVRNDLRGHVLEVLRSGMWTDLQSLFLSFKE
jgi:Replication protein